MPQLRTTLTNIAPNVKLPVEQGREGGASAEDPMLLALSSGRHPTVIKMGILGTVLKDTIVDRGSGVNVLPEDTWKRLGQPTLWPPTFHLLTTDQHGIKPLGVLTAQPVMIGTQPFLVDVVIPLKRKGYDAILGRGWLIQVKAKHDWKKNTLSLESKGRKYIIDLHTQMVGEEAAWSDSKDESENDEEGKKRMEPDEEGVLRLEGGSDEDDLNSLNDLFQWQMEDYELFPSCNMLRVDEGKKEEENECPKEHKEAEEGKTVTAEAEGKNTQYEPRRREDSTIRSRRKKVLRRTMDIAKRCWQQGRQIIWFAQETKRKGLIKVAAVRSGGVIDGQKGQLTKSMVSSFGNKLGDMENRMERLCTLNKLDEQQSQV